MGIRLSYSRYVNWKRSPRAYYLNDIAGLKEDKYKGAFIIGDCMDQAAGHLTLNKDLKAAVELFKDKFRTYDTYLGTLDVLTSDLIKWSKTEGSPESWYNEKAEMALKAYYEQVIPHFKEVHGIQIFTQIKDNHGNVINGFADKIVTWELDEEANEYIDEKGDKQHYHDPELSKWNNKVILFDDKCSTMKYTIPDSEQLATYKEAPNIINIDAEGYIVIPKSFRKKKEPLVPIKISIDKVLDDTVQSVFEGYQNMLDDVRLGNFPCNKKACDNGPFGCPYKKFCESNGTNLEGLIYVRDGKKEKSRSSKKRNDSAPRGKNKKSGKTA